jgi:hypothetical protein
VYSRSALAFVQREEVGGGFIIGARFIEVS